MIEHLPQALSSLSAALSISQTLLGIRDSAKLQEAVIHFNSAIIDAQSKIMASQGEQAALTTKIEELKKECVSLKNWEAEREEYNRKEVSPGVFVYIEKNFVGQLRNAHKYCCNCFDNYKKSTLQQSIIDPGMKIALTCHNKCPDLLFFNYMDTK